MKCYAFMNRMCCLVWNRTLGVIFAVAKNAKLDGKLGTERKLLAAALSLADGATTTQSSQNLAMNWHFSGSAPLGALWCVPSTCPPGLRR